ncbi:MAG TPA: zinc ribbon domain-containing protein [Candidatus Glassbacteria bacterium]|nr:zinc ribbon domain-containing protein [Candidatus Glassbacteria bacterium]
MTYEYKCQKCNNEWEEEQSIHDEPIKICPKCKHETAYRLISRGTGFILKGNNWAASGYSSK